jgi:hypothetical protein
LSAPHETIRRQAALNGRIVNQDMRGAMVEPQERTPTEARQGRIVRGGAVARILMIALALVIVVFVLAFLIAR